MEVRSGATWSPGGTAATQEYAVTLTDEDGRVSVGETWDEMPVRDRCRWLSAEADVMVVRQMAQAGGLSREFAARRLTDLVTAQRAVLAP